MKFFSLIILSLFLSSCASRSPGWQWKGTPMDLSREEQRMLRMEAFNHWARRSLQENLEESLNKFEMLHAANSQDIVPLVYLSRGYYLMAHGHLKNHALKLRYFDRAAAFGEKALALNQKFKEKISQKKSVEEAVQVLEAKEVEALYWTAAALLKWTQLEGFRAWGQKDKIFALMKKVEELRPDYFHGGVPRFWGEYFAYYGELEKSKENFLRSLELAPEFLDTRVSMAESYWIKVENKLVFKSEVERVIASRKTDPQFAPENKLAQARAEQLLADIEKLF